LRNRPEGKKRGETCPVPRLKWGDIEVLEKEGDERGIPEKRGKKENQAFSQPRKSRL